jgi:hypothetical protein
MEQGKNNRRNNEIIRERQKERRDKKSKQAKDNIEKGRTKT